MDDGKSVLLLEAGIRKRTILAGYMDLLMRVQGCLITHEHQDHAKAALGLPMAGIDVYASGGTFSALNAEKDRRNYRLHSIKAGEQFTLGTWTVLPWEAQHDAAEPLGFLLHLTQALAKRVGHVNLIQILGRMRHFLAVNPYNPGRDPHGGGVVRYFFQYYSTGSYPSVISHSERPKHLGTGTNQHIIPQRRVTFAMFLSGTSQRYVLIYSAVISNFRGFSDDDSHSMVDKKAFSNGGARMNFNSGFVTGPLTNPTGNKFMIVAVKPVGLSISPDCLKTGIKKIYLQTASSRRVSGHNGIQFLL